MKHDDWVVNNGSRVCCGFTVIKSFKSSAGAASGPMKQSGESSTVPFLVPIVPSGFDGSPSLLFEIFSILD